MEKMEKDYYLVIEEPDDSDACAVMKAGVMSGHYSLDQQVIDAGQIFLGVEKSMFHYMKQKFPESVNYKNFGTWLYERPKKTLHELIDQIERLSRPRREWLYELIWNIIFLEYGDIEIIKKLKEHRGNITHDVIHSL